MTTVYYYDHVNKTKGVLCNTNGGQELIDHMNETDEYNSYSKRKKYIDDLYDEDHYEEESK